MRRESTVVIILILLAAAAPAQETGEPPDEPDFGGPVVSAADRFSFYTECSKIAMSVSFVGSSTAIQSSLTREMIKEVVLGRLRTARLLGGSPYHIQVGVRETGEAATMWVFFLKPFHDPLTGQTRAAVSWSRILTGARLRNPRYLLSSIRNVIDEFLDIYQRVNEEACEER